MQIVIDYETRSEIDIKRQGAHVYASHPSTEIMCMAYKIEDDPTRLWLPSAPNHEHRDIRLALSAGAIVVAHNASFERAISKHIGFKYCFNGPYAFTNIPLNRWRCTAAKAATHALPRNLEGACAALKLPIQKDLEGRRLMLKMCKPRRASKNNTAKWHEKPEELKRLYEYCITDVEAEYLLDKALQDLSEKERRIWCLDQKVNEKGIYIDRELAVKAVKISKQAAIQLNDELQDITSSHITTPNQVAALALYLRAKGYPILNLNAASVETALADPECEGEAKRILEIRAASSKSSVKKYQAFLARAQDDNRVRGTILYHGAHTGRFTGLGLQPHNLPKGTIKNTEIPISIIKEGDINFLKLAYGDLFSVLSACVRGVIKAEPGNELFCSDFSTIEVRVLFWLARHEAGLAAFRAGRDLYKEMAADIYHQKLDEINSFQRQVGKTTVLGAGYQLGWRGFYNQCQMNKIIGMTEGLAKDAVDAYRSRHKPVVKMWSNMEKASLLAVQTGKRYTINRVTWFKEKDFLYCQLPSGRKLAYYGPEIRNIKMKWGEMKPCLHHWAVNPKTKAWNLVGTYGGKLTENVTQAVARDIMAEAMLRVEDAGYPVILSVHDELLSERIQNTGSLEEYQKLMMEVPLWAEGCPIKAEGWKGPRYKK